MSDFVDKLYLKEQAEEDLYCARHDRELIEAMHRREAEQLAQEAETAARKRRGCVEPTRMVEPDKASDKLLCKLLCRVAGKVFPGCCPQPGT